MSDRMKCPRCGKRFKQANRKQVFCADCLAKERQAKKNAPPGAAPAGHGASAGAGQSGAGSAGITIVQATPPPETAVFGARARDDDRHIQMAARPASPPPTPPTTAPASPAGVMAPANEKPERAERPEKSVARAGAAKQAKQPRSTAPQQEKRTRPPRPAPFELTSEIRATIEQRYLDLAQPIEFDGIRTQIAGELGVPKPVVKQVIQELRTTRQLPSWWELQAYKGSDDELERIRERYAPTLPVPPVGVHKQIASELQIDPPQVYQAIRRLRAEMRLPQYNPPESHTEETRQPAGADEATDEAPTPEHAGG